MLRNDARVLIVDDDPGIREALRVRFEAAGYRTCAVSCGEDALLACSPHPPDVVILDVCMPGLDGYQVCERIREYADAPQAAIIFLTGTTHAGTTSSLGQLVNQSGGDYYLAKPYDPGLLLDLVGKVVDEMVTTAGV